MEEFDQMNGEFNAKKPKKKGLLIGGIVAAVIIVALVLVYFLVLTNPKFIFSKAIDKLLTVDSEEYESIKLNTTIKASVEAEDLTMQTQLAEVEKYAVEAGIQMDSEEKKEIVDLGLKYDNQPVIDAQVYYNNGEMYAYFEGIFDKYIQIDMEEEQKEQLDEIFDSINSEDAKNSEKIIKIVRDEFKAQIKEKGEFEKEKTTLELEKDEINVMKSTLVLTQKQFYSVVSGMCTELAGNDEFIDCFEESPKDALKELASEIKDAETNSKNKIKISVYTKGLLNKLVGLEVEVLSAEEDETVILSIIEEKEDLYAYNVVVKTSGVKADLLNGKLQIEKDNDSKEKQSGKAIITAEVIGTGSAKLEVDYSIEYNNGIDKIDVANKVNMNSLTEADLQSAITKLSERPLIGDLIKESLTTQNQSGVIDGIEIEDEFLTDPDTMSGTTTITPTTSQNEVRDEDYGYSVSYSVPSGFTYEKDYSYDYMKYYELENDDYSYIDANVSLEWDTETEYIQDEINWDYNYYKEDTESYKNVTLSQLKTVAVGDKTFKYVTLSYETDYGSKYQNAYVWYTLGSEYLFVVELEAYDTEITEDMIKGFLNINVTELN